MLYLGHKACCCNVPACTNMGNCSQKNLQGYFSSSPEGLAVQCSLLNCFRQNASRFSFCTLQQVLMLQELLLECCCQNLSHTTQMLLHLYSPMLLPEHSSSLLMLSLSLSPCVEMLLALPDLPRRTCFQSGSGCQTAF